MALPWTRCRCHRHGGGEQPGLHHGVLPGPTARGRTRDDPFTRRIGYPGDRGRRLARSGGRISAHSNTADRASACARLPPRLVDDAHHGKDGVPPREDRDPAPGKHRELHHEDDEEHLDEQDDPIGGTEEVAPGADARLPRRPRARRTHLGAGDAWEE